MNNLRKLCGIACAILCIATARKSHAHGIPVVVGVVNDTLTLTGNSVAAIGYAPLIVTSADEDSAMAHVTLPNFGPVGLTSFPGFRVSGMEVDSGLHLNIFPRPVNNVLPVQEHLLWYASGSSVASTPSGESLTVASEFGQVMVPQTAGPIPPALKIANPNAEDLNEHVHYLRYLLDDAPPAAIGVYGFFAYVSSPNYAPSGRMLLVFNNGVEDPAELEAAALAINAAAFLPGDFNHDDRVDAADYALWRRNMGTPDEYNLWRGNFGASYVSPPLGSGAIVPEATSILTLLAWAIGLKATFWRIIRA